MISRISEPSTLFWYVVFRERLMHGSWHHSHPCISGHGVVTDLFSPRLVESFRSQVALAVERAPQEVPRLWKKHPQLAALIRQNSSIERILNKMSALRCFSLEIRTQTSPGWFFPKGWGNNFVKQKKQKHPLFPTPGRRPCNRAPTGVPRHLGFVVAQRCRSDVGKKNGNRRLFWAEFGTVDSKGGL